MNDFMYFSDLVPQERRGIRKRNSELLKKLVKDLGNKDLIGKLALNNKALIWFILEGKIRISKTRKLKIDREELFCEIFADFYEQLCVCLEKVKNLEKLPDLGFFGTFIYRVAMKSCNKILPKWEIETENEDIEMVRLEDEHENIQGESKEFEFNTSEITKYIVDADFYKTAAVILKEMSKRATSENQKALIDLFKNKDQFKESRRKIIEDFLLIGEEGLMVKGDLKKFIKYCKSLEPVKKFFI